MMTLRERYRIAEGSAVEYESAVISRYRRQKLCDGFILADFRYLNSALNGVARTHGSAEVPINMQEDCTGTRQVFGHHRVQNGADDSSLDHDSAEACRLGQLLIVV